MTKAGPLYAILLLSITVPPELRADAAAEALLHYNRFKTLFAAEEYLSAFQEIAQAEALDPGNSAYPFEAGDACLKAYSFKRIDYESIRDKLVSALEAFQRAKAKGHGTARVEQKIGECCYWLYRKEEALQWVKGAYARNKAGLEALLQKGRMTGEEEKEAAGILYELVENIFYMDTSGGDSIAAAEEVFRATENYRRYSGRLQTAMVTCFANAARILGDHAFGKGLWDEAIAHYRSIVFSEKETGHVIPYHKSWHMDEMVALVEKRKKLGEVKPEYVHPILVVYVTETRMLYKDGTAEVLENVTPGQKNNYGVWLDAMRHALEALSDGGWSVSFLTHDAKSEVVEGGEIRQHQDRSFLPEYAPCRLANDYDTYCIVSNDVSGRARYGYYAYVPFMTYGVKRGWFQCGNGREYNFRMWLHEFYHTIGFIQENGPIHGWSETETELAFYVRHFAGAIRAKGWKFLNFRFAYRETILPEDRFRELSETFRRIPRPDLLRAESLKEQALALSRTDRNGAIALCEQACAINPYQEWALKYLADSYLADGNRKEKAVEFNNRYAKVLPEGKAEQRLGDMHKQLGNTAEAGRHYRTAVPFLEAAIKEDPLDWQAAINLAELLFFSLNEKARAVPYYRSALRNGPEGNFYKWYLHGGQALQEAGEYREALSNYEKGLNLLLQSDPSSSYLAHYYYWMAIAHGDGLGDKAEAIRILEKAVRDGYSRSFTTDLLKKYGGSR